MIDRKAIYERRNNAQVLAIMRPAISLPLLESLNDIPLLVHEVSELENILLGCREYLQFDSSGTAFELCDKIEKKLGIESD